MGQALHAAVLGGHEGLVNDLLELEHPRVPRTRMKTPLAILLPEERNRTWGCY